MGKFRTELKWAIIFTVVSLAWLYFEKLMGWHSDKIADHATYTNLYAIPAIAMYVLALRDKRTADYGGVMSFKQGFMSGLILTVIIAMLAPLTQLLVHQVISPEYFPNVIAYAVSEGMMTQPAAEQWFSLSSYIIQSVIGAVVMGLVTAAIVAFFLRKSGAAPEQPNEG